MPSITSLLNKTIKYLLTLLVVLTPLVFVTNTNELFEFPKMFLTYVLGSTLIYLFVVKTVIKPQTKVPINKWVLLFLGGTVISTTLSTHKYTSLWGYYTRFNGGLVSILIFIGVYIVARYNPQKEEILSRKLIFSAIPISMYGILQHFTGVIRVHSTFGQPNWLAAYLAMVLPFIIYKVITTEDKTQKIFSYVIYASCFSALWFTYSLSGMLGFVVSMCTFCILNRKLLLKNLKPMFILLSITFVIAITNLGVFGQRLEDIWVDLTRVYAQENTHNLSDTGFIRAGMWKSTLKMIFASPKNFLVGTGPETFAYEFPKYRSLELNYSSEWDFILNKPHNFYLETLAETGLIGTLPYLALIIQSVKKKHHLLTPSLIALYTTNLFSWATVTTGLLFWIFLANLEDEK